MTTIALMNGAIIIYLTKAFDMVDHYLFLDTLYSIGFYQKSLFKFNFQTSLGFI